MKYYKTLSLGCKVNTYETQAVKELLEKEGYVESHDEKCDVFVINTCAVTQVGEQKSRQMIRKSIKSNPNATFVVMGCYSQLHPEVVKEIEGTDVIIGTTRRSDIIPLIKEYNEKHEQIVHVNKDNRKEEYEECLSIVNYTENTRAFVKVQDGCNNFCSYCIIPYTRGGFRSRDKDSILKEIHDLADASFQEIVITGVDTAGYGMEKKDGYRFNDLLKDILNEEPRIKRIRISSIEASQIDDEFIDILKNNPRIASHLHIPLQSGSAGVLKRMHRKYTKEEFLSKIKKIREALPDIALACDVIVGFPGETEEEFVECCDFIKECGFDYLHVFPYSIRPGTLAAKMENQIDPKVKKDRVHRLIAIGNELKDKYESKFDGKDLDVIIESYDPKTKEYKGYSSNYIEVHVKSSEELIGKYITAKYIK